MSIELNHEYVCGLLPERSEASHKGTFGHVFVLAGSRGFTGGAKLTCCGAERSGVGLVTLGIPRPLADAMAADLTESMQRCLPATEAESLDAEGVKEALEFAADKEACVLGPGIGQHASTKRFVMAFVKECEAPLLIDADGLNNLSGKSPVLLLRSAPTIVTPHPGEMARLINSDTKQVQQNRERIASDYAKSSGAVTVLKGFQTVVASPEGKVALNTTGNNGLAKGGSGDVLSGLMGGLLAQGMDAFDAACLAVYVHGRAGDLAAEFLTARGMIASDVIGCIPSVWEELELQWPVALEED